MSELTSVKEARKILGKKFEKMSDQEVLELIRHLTEWASFLYDRYKASKK